MIYIQNLDHTLSEQGLTLIVGLLFARVVYVKPASTDPREYLFGFTSGGTIEGYSIPIIDSTNNHGSNLFFLDKYLYSIRYSTNPVKLAFLNKINQFVPKDLFNSAYLTVANISSVFF